MRWLEARGLTLIERNFRCPAGELDLILRDGRAVVFVEVRQRASASHGGAAASVTPAKQRRLIRAAQRWLQQRGVRGSAAMPPCRFDVVAIDGDAVQWLKNVIEAD